METGWTELGMLRLLVKVWLSDRIRGDCLVQFNTRKSHMVGAVTIVTVVEYSSSSSVGCTSFVFIG